MEAIREWGVQIILWFQQFSPALDLPFKALTFMGAEEFFLIFLPLIYWCLERRLGVRLIVLFLSSTYINTAAKQLGGQPRPFVYAPNRVQALDEAWDYGFPSGHTQGAVTIWGYLAYRVRRTWFWVIAGILMILIPLSRIYLGVHFPTDVLGGYLMGVLVLFLFLWLEPRASAWLGQRGLVEQMGIAIGVPLLMVLLLPTEGGVKSAGALLGMAIGFVLERHWVGFDAAGPWWKRALRFLVGMPVVAVLYLGLGAVFSDRQPETLFWLIRYGLVGVWGALGAPWVFTKIGLSVQRRDEETQTK